MGETQNSIDRASYLISALGKISAQVARVSSPEQVFDTLREEISKLDLNFAYISINEDQNSSTFSYTSFNLSLIKPLEIIAGQSMIGFTIPRSEWPPIIDDLDPNIPLYVEDFIQAIRPAYAQFPKSLFYTGLKTVGITKYDSAIFNSIKISDNSSGILITWGKSLQENDLQAFSILGNQIGSSLEQAILIEIEKNRLKELERSNSLILALAKISTLATSSFIPTDILHSLAQELKGLGLDYYLCLVDKYQKEAEIVFVSPDIKRLKTIERVFKDSIIGFKIPIESWPTQAAAALHSKSAVFVENFYKDAKGLFNKFPDKMAGLGLDLIGISETTTGVHVASEFQDGTTAILSVWGPDLKESDLTTFSIYASQISNTFELARLIAAEKGQTANLRKSNTILEALGRVAAKVATSNEPDSILKTLGDELLEIGIECLVVLLDEESNEGYIRYHSMKSSLLKKANKLSKTNFSNLRKPLPDFPGSIKKTFETNQPYYIDDFRELIKGFIGTSIPESIANKVTGIVGITEETRGVFLPLSTSEKVFGCLSLWDKQLKENNLSTLSVFSHQIAIAFENARLFELEKKQAEELQLWNTQLKALNRIASRLSIVANKGELIAILNDELKAIDLDFAYLTVIQEDEKAVIDHISLDPDVLERIKSISGITFIGREVSQDYYPPAGIISHRNNETIFFENLPDYLKNSFQFVPSGLITRLMNYAGITNDTAGMFLPIHLGNGSSILIIIWGKSLRKENLAAFRVYATQLESKLEAARLYVLAQQEIMDRKQIQLDLSKVQKEYRGLFENAHDAIIISDPKTFQILNANDRALEIFGYSDNDIRKIKLTQISGNKGVWKKHVSDILRTKEHTNFEISQFRKDDDSPIIMEVNAGMVIFDGKESIQSIHRDVTDRKELEEQLTHEVLHDTLTALPNRLLFFDRLEHAIAQSKRTQEHSFAILFLDLDRFKDVNDNHGHLLGDKVLIDISRRIKKCTRGSDTVARFGGDEFVILQENLKSIQDSSLLCERILDHIEQPIFIGDSEIRITASIGIVLADSSYIDAEQYLRDADIALYRAKDLGKARFDYFNIDMRTAVIYRYKLEKDLRKALENHEFSLVYQPIVNLSDKKIRGLEALIRWQHPEQGIISPVDFIPIAENIGIIHDIGRWVLEEACTKYSEFVHSSKLIDTITLNVNISPIQLLKPTFPDEVKQILQKLNFDPQNLALELTETAFINDQENAAIQVDGLKEIGCQIHLDDFGTGFSSLSFINQFSIDCLKIERQFISGIDNLKQRNLISAILALGEKLDMSVIAEGIEDESQHEQLQDIGCLFGQGYYYAKPITFEQIPDLIHSLGNDIPENV